LLGDAATSVSVLTKFVESIDSSSVQPIFSFVVRGGLGDLQKKQRKSGYSLEVTEWRNVRNIVCKPSFMDIMLSQHPEDGVLSPFSRAVAQYRL
jgi:hypothetical protein